MLVSVGQPKPWFRFSSSRHKEVYDVVVVGGGIAGLSTAIRIKQLESLDSKLNNAKPLRVCVLEKGTNIGSHILSGCVLDTNVLDEFLPSWRHNSFSYSKCSYDNYSFLMGKYIPPIRIPTPRALQNKNKNIVVSLGDVCKWLSKTAEGLGVDVFSGFGASKIIYEGNKVVGVSTSDIGINKNNKKTSNYSPGMNIYGRLNVFAEGCRGHLSEQLISKYGLDKNILSSQTYGLGIKEVWKIPTNKCPKAGSVYHTFGWPMSLDTYGGSFMYSMGNNLVSIGYIVALNYKNPNMDPFQEFQKFKTHFSVKRVLKDGEMVQYGARTMTEGGLQSLPTMHFPGGLVIGDSAGLMNMARLKGAHLAAKSGLIAAETAYPLLKNIDDQSIHVNNYDDEIRKSWIWKELREARNIRPSFGKFGLFPFMAYCGLDMLFLRGRVPFTFRKGQNHFDHKAMKPSSSWSAFQKTYPVPDNKLVFDRSYAMSKSNVSMPILDQPSHLQISNKDHMEKINSEVYDCPETRFCPAGVYSYRQDANGRKRIFVSPEDCLHCKACVIKDPTQSISWTLPQGKAGPNYESM